MCNLWKDGDRETEMSIEDIEKWANWLCRTGIATVSIGGGEPFLRKDLPQIVRALSAVGIRTRVLTNGVAPDMDMIERAASAGLVDASISLDSLVPDTHDRICNQDGAWAKTIENLSHFRTKLKRRGSIVLVNTVVSGINLREIPSLVDFCEETGLFISLVPVYIPQGDEPDLFAADAPEFSVGPGDFSLVEDVYGDLLRRKRRLGNRIFNSRSFLRNSVKYLLGDDMDWRCDAGSLYLSLSPRGEVSICHRFKGVKPETYRQFEDFLLDVRRGGYNELKESCPGCLRPCWAEISLFFGDRSALLDNVLLQASALADDRARPSPGEMLRAAQRHAGSIGR